MKFMFSTVYRVTQNDFYVRRYTSVWAPVVAQQISERYSSSCHVFISMTDLHELLKNDSRTRSKVSFLHGGLLRTLCTGEKFERDLADLRQRIIEAVELITPHMLINTWQELEYRLDICRATTGAHIEVYGRA